MTSLCFVVQLADRTSIVAKGVFIVCIIGTSLLLNHSPSEWFSAYKKPAAFRGRRLAIRGNSCQLLGEAFFRITSWLPPSTMEVEDTTVRRAFCCNSSMLSAPQLHMVLRTLYSVVCTPSASGPA